MHLKGKITEEAHVRLWHHLGILKKVFSSFSTNILSICIFTGLVRFEDKDFQLCRQWSFLFLKMFFICCYFDYYLLLLLLLLLLSLLLLLLWLPLPSLFSSIVVFTIAIYFHQAIIVYIVSYLFIIVIVIIIIITYIIFI